jgi:hypothetical protein
MNVPEAAASTASRPAYRDDREPPLLVGRDGERYSFDLPDGRSEIFFQQGLDSPNQLDLVEEFRVCVQAILPRRRPSASETNLPNIQLICPSGKSGTGVTAGEKCYAGQHQ